MFLYRRACQIREKVFGAEHPQVAASLENYATLLREMNYQGMAAALEARAEQIRAKLAQATPTK